MTVDKSLRYRHHQIRQVRIATHQEAVWRDRADYIIRVDLADHGMPGSAEQMWTRATSDGMYEICCIPFFTYGIALGDADI